MFIYNILYLCLSFQKLLIWQFNERHTREQKEKLKLLIPLSLPGPLKLHSVNVRTNRISVYGADVA